MFSMYPSHPTQHQDKKMKSEHLSSNMFSSQTKTAPGEGSMFEAVALQQIQKIPVVQIFKYSWQKKTGKSMKMKIMIFKSYGKISGKSLYDTSKSEIQTAVSLDCMSLALKPLLCAFYFVVQNGGNSTEKHTTTRHVTTTACAHDQSM